MYGSFQTQSSLNVLDLASRIYVADNIATSQHFSAIAETFYKTEIKNINFDHPVKAAFDINQWINITTHGRIPGLVNAGVLKNMFITCFIRFSLRFFV